MTSFYGLIRRTLGVCTDFEWGETWGRAQSLTRNCHDPSRSCFNRLTNRPSQRTPKATLKYAMRCIATLGPSSAMVNSLHNSVHPPELKTHPPKTVCGCPCGWVVQNDQQRNPLTLRNVFAKVHKRDLQSVHLGTVRGTTFQNLFYSVRNAFANVAKRDEQSVHLGTARATTTATTFLLLMYCYIYNKFCLNQQQQQLHGASFTSSMLLYVHRDGTDY